MRYPDLTTAHPQYIQKTAAPEMVRKQFVLSGDLHFIDGSLIHRKLVRSHCNQSCQASSYVLVAETQWLRPISVMRFKV